MAIFSQDDFLTQVERKMSKSSLVSKKNKEILQQNFSFEEQLNVLKTCVWFIKLRR